MESPISPPKPAVRVAAVLCAVLEDEFRQVAASMPNVVHLEIMEQGLHNEPNRLRLEVQAAIDRVEAEHEVDAIVLGYGLCSRGTEGLVSRRAKLVVPRAHDCITVLLGNKERYATYAAKYPGTYWYSPGWNRCHIPPGPERYEKLRAEYVEKYGEDNADFLMESEQAWFKSYSRATFVEMGIAVRQEDIVFTKNCAKYLAWSFDHQHGDPKLLHDLLAGDWDDERFLVLEPGETLRMTADGRVMEKAVTSDAS